MENFYPSLFACLCVIILALPSCTLDNEPAIPTEANNIKDPVFLNAAVTADIDDNFIADAELSSLGNLNILHHGWVWSEAPGPTILNDHLDLGKLIADTFSIEIAGLDLGKVYYLRPFVANGCDTVYGPEQCSFFGANFTINTDTAIFKGADVQFTNTIPCSNCMYLWDFNDGETSTLASPKHTFKNTGNFIVRLTVDLNGCKIVKTMALSIVDDPFEDYWIPIQGGAFIMGCTDDQQPECNDHNSEMPPHPVTVNPFQIGKTEVTQQQWIAVMGSNSNPSYWKQCGLDCPVESVTWNNIRSEFIPALYRKTGRMYRLPTEAEWEYAARGGQAFKYAGDTIIENVAWNVENSDSMLHPVTKKNSNGYNLHDMSGNVWEWVEDDFHNTYNGAPQNGSAWVDTPRAPERVFRGGGYDYAPEYCRIAFRVSNSTELRTPSLGFRLAR